MKVKLLLSSAVAVLLSTGLALQANAVTNTEKKVAASTESASSDENTKSDATSDDTAANDALPQAPTLKISGFTVFNLYGNSQRDNFAKSNGTHASIDVSELAFNIYGVTATGITYGYTVRFRVRPGTDAEIRRNYIQFAGWFGKVVLGAAPGPDQTLIKGSARLATGTGMFAGGYTSVINASAGVFTGDKMVGSPEDAVKIAYYTPKFWDCLILAAAFTPNTSHVDDNSQNNRDSGGHSGPPGNTKSVYPNRARRPFGINNMSFGALLEQEFETWLYAVSGAMIFDKSKYVKTGTLKNADGTPSDQTGGNQGFSIKGTKSYRLAAMIGFKDIMEGLLEFAVGFMNNKKSRMPENNMVKIGDVELTDVHEGNAGRTYDGAVRYSKGMWRFAVAHQRTVRKTDATQKATAHVSSIGVDVIPVQGLKFSAEVTRAHMKTNEKTRALHQRILNSVESRQKKAIGDNHGTAVIFSSSVNF